jgi:hypothetical protein
MLLLSRLGKLLSSWADQHCLSPFCGARHCPRWTASRLSAPGLRPERELACAVADFVPGQTARAGRARGREQASSPTRAVGISIPTALETHESMGIDGELSPKLAPWLFCLGLIDVLASPPAPSPPMEHRIWSGDLRRRGGIHGKAGGGSAASRLPKNLIPIPRQSNPSPDSQIRARGGG